MPHLRMVKLPTSTDDRAYEERWIYVMYLCVNLEGQKSYQVHRFVRECYNGLIPDGKVIDYINEIRDDNLLYNLQLMTQQQNCKKTDKKRDYTFVKFSHQNKKCVKAVKL